MYLVFNFKSNQGTYGHDFLEYERDARGANLHPGVYLLPGANCAHEHGLSNVICRIKMKDLCRK